ncbi:DNA mismatch endonuclease Vsr [Crenobacter sp. SG2303]|uniref:Very short patch repair endonuclease n=1 Tax=Crenobacter oryzisoli TaxID=3056844 RepID=A0ABT7XP06_9NEIS|nr:DNA mismatch endonuclease Vsr [Crenobacter sp. SG2303]MDN0075490.1 DNA mismatch endonuclease Vsr [Crenobacter sp. SG2303]
MDVVDARTRSRMMSGIRGRDTKPEILVRKALFAERFRFRLHRHDLPGSPDIVLPRYRVAIFVHGCFWHMHAGCRYAKMPATRTDFWSKKLRGNVERDARAMEALVAAGWRVLVVWECATRDAATRAGIGSALSSWIAGGEVRGEIAFCPPRA